MKRSQAIPLLDKEISWLHFNHRLLQEAGDATTPLIERLRFLGIYANNLDEFFRVRVASVRRVAQYGGDVSSYFIERPKRLLTRINRLVLEQQQEFDALYAGILRDLSRIGIRLIDESQISSSHTEFLDQFYFQQLDSLLAPVVVTRKNTFPDLADSSIYLLVVLHRDHADSDFALIEIPAPTLPRFVELPAPPGEKHLIFLDDIIRHFLPRIFASLPYVNFSAYSIKVTRDADIEHDLDGNLVEKISRAVHARGKGAPVRLCYDRTIPPDIIRAFQRQQKRRGTYAHTSQLNSGRYDNLRDFMSFPNLGGKSLAFPSRQPVRLAHLDSARNISACVEEKDVFLHCPYQSFSHYIRLLSEAAIDPEVRALKITLYRLASNSRIVGTLINAARNGKSVTVIIELLARFDEEANIRWARRMEEAGIRVIYGVKGLKVHAKLTHIERKGKNLACVSTGNFHEGNARVYTDGILMTADKRLVREVAKVFDFIEHPYKNFSFQHLLVSPRHMRQTLYEWIKREIKAAKSGKKAEILVKINHVSDPELIARLYAAARAGVSIKMLVRGNCSLVTRNNPAAANLSVHGIVDRYLEHARFLIFHNKGNPRYLLASADWMTRNLDQRIEVATPVYDPDIQRQIHHIIECGLRDNVKRRVIDGSGENRLASRAAGEKPLRSQEQLYAHAQALNDIASQS